MRPDGSTGSLLDNLQLILVQTQEPGNLGAAARAMMNMGLHRLRLVQPCDRSHPDCRALAGKAYSIVDNARSFEGWEEAVSEMSLLVATTSTRERLLERPVLTVRETARYVADRARGGDVGIVFGPERSGLSQAILSRCQILASVPSSESHPVLNLAQAVMVFCYELRLACLGQSDPPLREDPADQRQRRQMFLQLEELLTRTGFLSASQPAPIMATVRNLFRPDLSAREVRILRGVLSQLEWFLETGRQLPPERVRRK